VTVDGKPVKAPAPARLFRYHKPAGLLTAERDPKGRPTIYDRLPAGLPRVMPVGRLDLNTEGLLLLTTDGELKRQLELPSSGVERTYRARVFGEISQERLEDLIQGVEIEGIRYGSIDANLERRTGRNAWIELKLTEGKNREVRRVLEHLGLQVSRLLRTSYGPFPLADLPAGAVDEVRQHDLVAFRKGLGQGRPASRSRRERGEGGSASRADDQSRSRLRSGRGAVPGEAPQGPRKEPRHRRSGGPPPRKNPGRA
jgi:23S rRNA pseudouridine2605 synthase